MTKVEFSVLAVIFSVTISIIAVLGGIVFLIFKYAIPALQNLA